MKKKRLLPFWMMPGSWGLTGTTKAVAEAEYYYEGKELDWRIKIINAENDVERKIYESELSFSLGEMSQQELDTKVREIKDEPWVDIKVGFADPEESVIGYFDFDWNEKFIKVLHKKGYTGASDEAMVNNWFNRVCALVHAQNLADKDFGMEERNDYTQERPDVIKTSTPRKPVSGDEGEGETGETS